MIHNFVLKELYMIHTIGIVFQLC